MGPAVWVGVNSTAGWPFAGVSGPNFNARRSAGVSGPPRGFARVLRAFCERLRAPAHRPTADEGYAQGSRGRTRRPQRRLLQTRQQSPSISRMPESAQTQEYPSENSTSGAMGTLASTRVTTRSPMFEMARQYRVRPALPWCSEIEMGSGSSLLTIHLLYRR